MKPCEEFEITIHNVSLNFEFFTKEYIHEELAKIIDEDLVKEFTIPEEKPFAEIRAFYSSKKDLISRHFSYIKFFKDTEGELYGLVGGKTNYCNLDIRFDYLDNDKKNGDNRISRIFLDKAKNLEWDRNIIIVNHNISSMDKVDDQEARFIETFLQRKFNLFDS